MNEKKKISFADIYSKYGIFIILIAAVIISTILSDSFMTGRNISNIIRQNATVMIVAFGAQMLLITGEVDLSPGSVLGFSSVVSCMAMISTGSLAVALLVGIVIGAAFGLVNGWVVTTCGIPSFIMTLATQFIGRGAVYVLTDAKPVSGMDNSFKMLGQGMFLRVIPVPILIMVIVLILYVLLMHFRPFGRYVYAVGGNVEAAKASGINVKSIKIRAFIFAGAAAGLSGVILASRMNSGQPSAGEEYEFDAITAAIIGGTSMNGGIGKVYGVVVGALFVGVLLNIMTLLNISSYYQQIVKGAIIAIAVIIDAQVRRAQKIS